MAKKMNSAKRFENTAMRNRHLPTKAIKASLLKKVPLKQLLLATLILALLTIGFVVISLNHLPPEVPLFYGLPEGEDQLASATSLIVPSLVSIAVFLINATTVYLLEDKFIQSMLVVATFAVTLLSSITTIKIILLVNSFVF